jgi:glycosyltransferase involved in cell wall biosynthesis
MQSAQAGRAKLASTGNRERVFIGAAGGGRGITGKVVNQVLGWFHDLRVWRIVQTGNYDLIQVRDKPFASLIALLAARSRHIPFYYWMSFPFPEADRFRVSTIGASLTLWHRWFYRLRGHVTDWLLYRVILPRADHVFVQSEQMQSDVSARGVDSGKLTPVPMGISLAQVVSADIESHHNGRLSGRLPVVYVGTLARVRRMDFLVDAFRSVHRRMPQALLIMVGTGRAGDVEFLQAYARSKGLADDVVFTGFLPREQAWRYIRTARVCVSPFVPSPILNSTSPTKVVEYLALGRPVVANDHPDQAKVLNESGAGVSVPYDAEAFADAIVDLLSDPCRAEAMGKRGPGYVARNRSYEQLVDELEGQYLRLIHAGSVPQMSRQNT